MLKKRFVYICKHVLTNLVRQEFCFRLRYINKVGSPKKCFCLCVLSKLVRWGKNSVTRHRLICGSLRVFVSGGLVNCNSIFTLWANNIIHSIATSYVVSTYKTLYLRPRVFKDSRTMITS
jgi:hypothetical protein